jgi:tripartite motif-containing protein 71
MDRWKKLGVLLGWSLVLMLMTVVQAAPASALSFPPRYQRTIGGSGRPGVFAWGMQYNPVTNEMLVGDYLNFQIRRYDLNGNHLGDFWHADAVGQPYSIGVDPNDGSIYVAELKDNPLAVGIAKYDKMGNYLYMIRTSLGSSSPTRIRGFYTVWLTVEEDTGDVWVLDSHYTHTVANPPRVLRLHFDDATKTVTQLNAWPVLPPGTTDDTTPRLYGIDVGDDNRVYLSDAWNRRAYIYDQAGNLLTTFGQTQTGGDNREVVINEDLDRVYLVDAEHSDIDVFDLDGNFLFSFADEGEDAGDFAGGGRQADIDASGDVWAADFGGFEIEKFSANGTPLLTAPIPPRKPPAGLLAQPRDVAVDDVTGDVWVADAWAQRFQRFASDGTPIGAWGHRGAGGAFQMNYPRSIAIDPITRRIWVANERGHHIQVYNYPTSTSAAPTYVAQIGEIRSDDTDPGHFRWPVDIEFFTRTDGTHVAVIGDRMASSVKIFNSDTFQELLMIPATNHGTAVDPATGNIYVVNPSSDRIEVWDQTGVKLFQFGTRGSGNGQFQDGVDAVISQNVLYVSDESLSRVQAFDLNGTFLGKWGTSYAGGAYDFRGPVGLDADAQGRIYVTDSGNDRIQVFDPNLAKTTEGTNPAAPVVASPANQAVLPLAPVVITGTATDNAAVANVELSIQDMTTGKWWNSSNSSWETGATASRPALAGWTSPTAPVTNVSWRYTFLGVSSGGLYLMQVKTRDASGHLSSVVQRTFGMPGTSPPPPPGSTPDTTDPNGTLTFPTANASLPFAAVNFTGNATDNIGVTQVRVALKDVATGRWWTGSGTTGFGTTYTWWTTTLSAPGGTNTGWTWSWTPRAAGSYQIIVAAFDATGNTDQTRPNVGFVVTSNPPDGTPPDTAISAPADGGTVPVGTVTIGGSAQDDTAIASVRLTIQDTGTGLWWNGSAWSASQGTVNATLANPNAASTSWTYQFGAVAAGTYQVTATAVDVASNADASPATSSFSEAGSPDTQAPVTTVTFPPAGGSTASPVTITGIATDNVGVASVRVSIRNNATLQWWNGTSWGPFTYVLATLSAPGGSSTNWSYVFNPPSTGTFGLQVRSVDTSNNVGANTTWRNFTLT